MIERLVHRFIPNHEQTNLSAVRASYGVLSGCVGIFFNVLLCVGKLIAGAVSGSVAVVADALNNLSDAGSSVITLIGFRMSAKRPDPDHPFGHGRMEYICGLIVAMVIVLLGFEMLKTSVSEIFAPEPIELSALSAGILVFSVLVKLYMYAYNRTLSKRLDSTALRAAALDSRNDALATTAVLLAMTVAHFTGADIDGWVGLMVSTFILYSGFSAARDTINPLLGQSPDPNLVKDIRRMALETEDVLGVHDLIVHDYGPGRRMASLHAEVPAGGDIMALHDGIDRLENRMKEALGCDVVIHMDPIVTDDERVAPTRQRVTEAIQSRIDASIQLHDFRMTSGPTRTNVIFDAVAPYGFRLSDEELRAAIVHLVRELDDTYFAVVTIDHFIA